jgi:hypothetical protein
MERMVTREEERKKEIESMLGPEGLRKLEEWWAETERRFLFGEL